MIQIPDRHTTLDISGGGKWRALRKNMSPTFTSGRLKAMMEPMAGVADKMVDRFEELMEASPEGVVDVKETFQGERSRPKLV